MEPTEIAEIDHVNYHEIACAENMCRNRRTIYTYVRTLLANIKETDKKSMVSFMSSNMIILYYA